MSTDALREQIRTQVRKALGAASSPAPAADASVAALMRRFEAGYETVSAEAIVACFAPDVVWILPDSRVLKGREACLAFLKERFASPTGPKFSDSHMNVLGQTVVQNYKVSVPLPGGQTGTYDGTDVYQIHNGLIARKDAYWKQVGMPKPAPTTAAAAPSAPAQAAASPAGVVVPLRVGTAAQAAALTDLFKRLAASPALLQAAQSGRADPYRFLSLPVFGRFRRLSELGRRLLWRLRRSQRRGQQRETRLLRIQHLVSSREQLVASV